MEYWLEEGESSLFRSLDTVTKKVNEHAKNVIIFVGDGMSIPTVTAARYAKIL